MQKSKRFIQVILVLQLGMMQVAAFGQYKPVRFTVVDAKKQPISFANMAIQKLDSPYQRNQVTDSNGIENECIRYGDYFKKFAT
jgi:hypothetical protein